MTEPVPVTAEEYRKGKTKIISLPSGHVIEIRKMPVPVFAEMFETLGIEVPPGTPFERVEELMKEKMNDPKYNAQIINAILKVIPHCWVRPRISNDAGADNLSIDDVDPGDLFKSFSEILDFSGISRMAEEMRQKFRDKSSG